MKNRRLPAATIHARAAERRARGAMLRALRQAQGLTQTAAAALLDVSPAAFSTWERGTRLAPIRALEILRAALTPSA